VNLNIDCNDGLADINNGLGVMRFSVEVIIEGKKYSTPGIKSTDHLGIKNDVFKLVVREDDSYLGHIKSFFNVPGVFGSTPPQVDSYTGVDCADLVVGGYKKWKKKDVKYTNVNGLVKNMKNVCGTLYVTQDNKFYLDEKLTKLTEQKFEPGLIVTIDYPGTRKNYYDHVVVLSEDNGNGIVDIDDKILHCGPMELVESTLGSQISSVTRLKLLRW